MFITEKRTYIQKYVDNRNEDLVIAKKKKS